MALRATRGEKKKRMLDFMYLKWARAVEPALAIGCWMPGGGSCSAVNSPTAPARCRPLISCIHLQALDNHGPGLRFLMETGGQQREEVTFPKGLFQPQGLTQPASSPPRWRGTGSSRGMSSTKILTMLLSVVSGDTHTPPKGKSEQKPT